MSEILCNQTEQNIYRKTTTGASRNLLTPEQINELREREIRKLEFEASKRCLRNTCFPSGTLVHAKDGKIPIEQIEAGMMVYAQNIETGETGYQEVLSVSQTSVSKLFHIYMGDVEIQSTAMHQMYVYEKGFVTAQDLLVGGQLVYMEDGTQKQIPIDNITVQFYKIPVTVYNFKVNKWHTYMVGQLGFLVHNGERKCTPKVGGKKESGRKPKIERKNGAGTSDTKRMLGEKGTQVSSKTTWKNGKTERIDIENPAPGKRPGQIHYHDVNNNKYYYDIDNNTFYDHKTGDLASESVQRKLKDKKFMKGIEKALDILGETNDKNE